MGSFLEKKKQALLRRWKKAGRITDKRLLEAFCVTRREDFVLKSDRSLAYNDHPLQILHGQTISQPTTVMLMSQALEVSEGMKILEIGSGSGYQAAILSALVGEQGRIISIEYYDVLADFARSNLEKAGCTNVRIIRGDGGHGFGDDAPYDRIIVTCACPSLPPGLLSQLKTGGIMVVPVKTPLYDDVRVIIKTASGTRTERLGAFVFVPLRGEFG